MKFRVFCAFFVLSLLFISSITAFPSSPINDTTDLVYNSLLFVDDDNQNGPWDGSAEHPYYNLEQAVENASPLSQIYIKNGYYEEHGIIDKSLIITGEEKNSTIITGGNVSSPLTIIHPDVIIQELTIQNSGGTRQDAGINCISHNITVSRCNLFRTKTGIYCTDTSDIAIDNCFFYSNAGGIHLENITNAELSGNVFTHNSFGIISVNSHDLVLQSNNATVNGIGFYLENTSLVTIDRCALYNNNDNQGGIFLEKSNSVEIKNSHIQHNGFGIKTDLCKDVNIQHCTIAYNTHAGILCKKNSSNIIISYCEIAHNLRINIYMKFSSIIQRNSNNYDARCVLFSTLSSCEMKNNWWGKARIPMPFQILPFSYYYYDGQKPVFSPWASTQFDNAGANWSFSAIPIHPPNHLVKPNIIKFNEPDTDEDGIPDKWESTHGYDPHKKQNHSLLDPDEDGLTNIEECYAAQWGADPFVKDIFWEMDWMQSKHPNTSNRPDESLISTIKKSFADHGIMLHVDIGNLGGGEQIPYNDTFSIVDLRDYYWEYFLDHDLNNPRKGIFHYGLICDFGPSAGNAFFGWDNLDSFIVSVDKIGLDRPLLTRERTSIGGAVHELGHTLGLTVDDHGGNDNNVALIPFRKESITYLPYVSCMNYWYTYHVITFSDGQFGPTDFNDWDHMDLTFFKNTHFTLPERYS